MITPCVIQTAGGRSRVVAPHLSPEAKAGTAVLTRCAGRRGTADRIMLNRPAQLALVLTLVATALGCAFPTRPARTPFLDPVAPLSKGRHTDSVWFDKEAIARNGYSEILIAPVEVERVREAPGMPASECARILMTSVGQGRDSILVRAGTPGRPAELRLAITEMSPGSAFGRIMAGELGVGHAWVQVEGRLLDATTGELIGQVADRRRGSGMHGLRDMGGDSGPAMIREMLAEIGESIRTEVARAFASRAD